MPWMGWWTRAKQGTEHMSNKDRHFICSRLRRSTKDLNVSNTAASEE